MMVRDECAPDLTDIPPHQQVPTASGHGDRWRAKGGKPSRSTTSGSRGVSGAGYIDLDDENRELLRQNKYEANLKF